MFEKERKKVSTFKNSISICDQKDWNLRTCGLVGETIKDEGVGVNDVVLCSVQPFSEY